MQELESTPSCSSQQEEADTDALDPIETGQSAASASEIVESLTGNVALLDPDSVIVAVNEGWRQFARANGYLGNAFGVGTSYIWACGGEQANATPYAKEAVAAITGVLSGRLKCASFDYPCHAPDQKRWFRMVVSPHAMPNHTGALVMHFDVTEECLERKVASRSLQEMRRVEDLESKVAGIIHDVKAPLNAVSGMADFLRQGMAGPTTAKQQVYFSRMLEACEQGRELIDSEIAKLYDGGARAVSPVVDVKRALHDIVEMLSAQASRAGVKLETAFTARLPKLAVPSAVLLRIVGNLVTNSIHYAGPGACVTTSAVAMGSELAISVADNGVGVAEDELQLLIIPRRRGRHVSASGSGLGLSVVRDLANSYGANFAVASAPGEGLSVTLTFGGERVIPVAD